MKTVYITKRQLLKANRFAEKAEYECQLKLELLDKLDERLKWIVLDRHVQENYQRLHVALPKDPDTFERFSPEFAPAFIDVTNHFAESLATIDSEGGAE
jgi:hypothetical protein